MRPRTQFASGDDYAVKRDKKDKPKTATGGPTLCPTWDEMAQRHYAKSAYYERIGDHEAAKAHRRVAEGLESTARQILRLKRGM